MNKLIALFRLPVDSFGFSEEPSGEPKPGEPGSGTPPIVPPARSPEPKLSDMTPEQLKDSNPKLYDVIFGRGISKKSSNDQGLTKEEIAAAKTLFSSVKPEDVKVLLEAKSKAEQASLEKAKAEKDFNDFSAQLEEQSAAKLLSQKKAFETQINSLSVKVTSLEENLSRALGELTKSRITHELIVAAKAKGVIDPTDAVIHLQSKLKLDDSYNVAVVDESGPKDIEALVSELIKTKPHLVKSSQRPGTGATPPEDTPPSTPLTSSDEIPTFKRSQLTDTEFYRKHEDDILRAHKAGKIIDDISR